MVTYFEGARLRDPDVFAALANPTRRAILDHLRERPRTAGEIAARFTRISRPAVSKHLRVLRGAGLCRSRREGRRRRYALDLRRLEDLDRWLARYLGASSEPLSSLQRYVMATAA